MDDPRTPPEDGDTQLLLASGACVLLTGVALLPLLNGVFVSFALLP